ncbi:hypothetical protein [Nonomuraea zeae]|uniref:Carboxymuconolactone decarboxylase family protein n=1 Tax=Nonomuraea zeae TaxID=1642303 RepID=A0A5S4FZT9_9ACTN|nr:hypothetical protein [Nonomuraea zeae]TMR26218.1 hypothetical protein ETD85_43220 [Nonomuraea zeae]
MDARMKNPAQVPPGATQALLGLGQAIEQAALALAEQATRLADGGQVGDEVWDAAARHYSETEPAGLLMAIATVNLWNRLNAPTRQIAGSAW